MAGQRQPIELVIAKGNKHLTKAEIEARRNGEVGPLDGNIAPPGYLTKKQKAPFKSVSYQQNGVDNAMVRDLMFGAIIRVPFY